MKNNALTNFLVGLVVIAVLVTSGIALFYVRSVQNLNILQLKVAVINRNRTLASSLVAEAVEYSKHNPAIDPILQGAGLKPKPGSALSATPAQPKP